MQVQMRRNKIHINYTLIEVVFIIMEKKGDKRFKQ